MSQANTSAETTPLTANEKSKPGMWPVATVMATGVFATTFVQTQCLAYLPFNHLLQSMGLDSNKAATFLSLCILPWSFKVLAGLLVDGFPIFGSRRRAYLLLSGLIASVTWLLMGVSPGQYNLLLFLAIAMNTAIVFGSVTSGGLLVEAGQKFNASGRLTSLRMFAYNLGASLAAPIGGLLAGHTMKGSHPLFATSIVAIVPLTCMFFFSWFLLKEAPAPFQTSDFVLSMRLLLKDFVSWRYLAVIVAYYFFCRLVLFYADSFQYIWPVFLGGAGVGVLIRYLHHRHPEIFSWNMFWAALLLFFVQAVPTFRSTCFYQYQTGPLHYNDAAIGLLGFVGYGAALLNSAIYVWWCRKSSLRVSLYGAILVTSLSALPYLYYTVYTPYMPRAVVIEIVGNLFQFLAYLPLLDLAVRCTPKGSEALGYSVLIGVWNIGLMIGMKTGPMLYEQAFHKNMNSLIWLNAAVTLVGVVLVFLLPRTLVEKREGA